MSMLAEPRRKQRVGPNPRGKFFSEDEDNKGRHLLQKMGWQSGDGLGVQRQGIRDPIRPKIQSDARGLGFDIKSDAWVSHTDDFNTILQNLQVAHGVGVKEEEPEEEPEMTRGGFGFDQPGQGSSKPSSDDNKEERLDLETKSKASRSRIHYHKFVKNKDLSKIKDNDWSCIFGKDISQRQQEQLVEKELVTIAPPPPPIDFSMQLNGNSTQNRYKLQMLKSFTKSTLLEDQLEPHDGKKVEVVLEKPDIDVQQEEEPRKKKKKSKNKEKSKSSESEPLELEVGAEQNIITPEEEPKKKKKSKKKEKTSKLVEPEEVTAVEEVQQEDEPRKKKKKSKRSSPETVTVEEVVLDEDSEAPPPKKRKKSKKRSPSLETETSTVAIMEEIQSTHQTESLENSEGTATPLAEDVLTSATVNFNKRKISAVELHAAAAVFKGSNLLQIPGYRNQSSSLL